MTGDWNYNSTLLTTILLWGKYLSVRMLMCITLTVLLVLTVIIYIYIKKHIAIDSYYSTTTIINIMNVIYIPNSGTMVHLINNQELAIG